MLKRNKGTIVLTTFLTALPMLMGLVLWSRLPETIATHFGADGTPDGWSSKAFAVFGLPAFLAAVHLVCAFGTMADPKKKNIQDKMYRLVLWICPVVSILVCTCVYLYALGMDVDMALIAEIMVGMMFLIVGNYLPKCRQSYTMGLKLPWTLSDEENWNATHRFGGRLWMACGVVFLGMAALGGLNTVWTLGLILAAVGLPTLYSFRYYLLHKEEEV